MFLAHPQNFTFTQFDAATPGTLNPGLSMSCGLCPGAGSGDFNSDGEVNVLDGTSRT